MATSLALALVLAAVAVSYWRPLRRIRSALSFDHLLATGHAFLALGIVLGLMLDRPSEPFTEPLSPIVAWIAGWVGFATGMRFDYRVLRGVPRATLIAGLLPAAFAALVVGGLSASVLAYAGSSFNRVALAACVLAAAAASSSPALVATIRTRLPGRSKARRAVLRMVEFSSGIDDILVVLIALLSFAVFPVSPEPVGASWRIIVALLGGSLLGGLTWLFLGGVASNDERLLLGLGMLTFTAGFAGWLHLSPTAVAAVSAIVLVNLPGQRMQQLFEAVHRMERPAVVILMAVVGIHVVGTLHWSVIPLLCFMTLVRWLCKRWAASWTPLPSLRTRQWGDGLLPQGTLGLIIALSLFQMQLDAAARSVLAAVAVSSLLNELLAPWLFVRLLKSVTPTASEVKALPEQTA